MNYVKLIGNVGKEILLKEFENGKKLSFSLATNENYTNKNNEEVKNTVWHSVVAWGPLAEKYESFVEKGKLVAVEGRLSYRQYQNKDQVQTRVTEIVAYRVEDPKKEESV